MRPAFIDDMSWEMAEVYGAITDQILINLARHFPYFKPENLPGSAFAYQADMLAQMGQVNRETVRIIRNGLKNANDALQGCLEQAIIDSIKSVNPALYKAAKAGILKMPTSIVTAPNQMRAFQLYYQQAAQKLNMVNTVMLESTKQAYQATVSDIVNRVQATQTALDIGAGEVVTGVSSWNQAMVHSINRMKANGITGFIDHGGHRWSAEAYTAMDIRTTMANTARAAVWETNQDFGNDLYSVSYHDGARPLCYPWQNKVISSLDRSGVTYDLDGNEIQIYPQSSTSYGEPAGLFGINCKHYPTPFIPGVSLIRGQPMSEEANKQAYEDSQKQRALERKIREEKRDLMMMKAQGAPDEVIKAQRAKIRQTDDDIDNFCAETGRARRQNREGVYTERKFPSADTYDVTQFERTQKDLIEQFYKDGGAQQGYTFGQMTPKEPITPPTTPLTPVIQEKMPTNKNGEIIQFAEKMNGTEYNVTREQVAQLAAEFKTNLQNVKFGALTNHAAGDVDITGSTMRLSAPKRKEIIIHEFAHTLTNSSATKYGLNNDKEFWKEIRSIRTQYRKYIRANPTEYISAYAESDNSIDEFMAEGFALAYMRKNGIEVPFKYGKDTTYSELVLNVIQKYFGK